MIVRRVALCLLLAALPNMASAATPSPAQVKHLEQKLKMMLKDVAHKNEEAELTMTPDESGLKTIVRIRVRPDVNGQLRADMTKRVNEDIAIHRGDCRVNSSMRGTSLFPLNPIINGSSETVVEYPISTLTGHGDIITTATSDGTVVTCGKL
jgi:hypothetical protein